MTSTGMTTHPQGSSQWLEEGQMEMVSKAVHPRGLSQGLEEGRMEMVLEAARSRR
jgi:hypothetical protein